MRPQLKFYQVVSRVFPVLGLVSSSILLFSQPVLATTAQISNQGDTVHLEFDGQTNWQYEIKKVDGKGKGTNQSIVQMTIPPVNEASLKQLKGFTSPLIKSIAVDTKGPDGNYILTFQLGSSAVEPFDYLTEKPSRLIVDFFKNGSLAKSDGKATEQQDESSGEAEPEVAEKKSEPLALPKKMPAKKAVVTKEGQRKPANADVLIVNDKGQQISINEATQNPMGGIGSGLGSGLGDGGDPKFDRFNIKDYEIKDESIIASKENVYLDFPMLKIESPFLQILQTKKPVYEIEPNDTDENRQARLLLTLYNNKRYNVFLKTVDWFLKKYDNGQYDEIVRFMWADALYALWNEGRHVEDFDLAMLRYRQAIEKYPQSPLLERTMMLMGFATLDRGDYLGTLRLFQSHLEKRPQSPNKDIAKLAIADAYLKIKRFDEAVGVYGDLEKSASGEKYKLEATFRKGDVAYQRKDYKKAIEEYQDALKKNPKAAPEYPSAYYNQASAYFNTGEYRKALDTYREFLKNYPTHEESGYAMTRVGEILDILGADKSRVLGTYLETYFRFGDTPSSVVARLRMLSERMNTMKPKEVEKAVKDIQELSKKSELPKMDQFATLMVAEGYNRRQEYDKAVDLLVKYYQANPNTADTGLLKSRIVKNINEDLKNLVDKNNFIDALKLHNKYADNWLKHSDRIDTKFNVGRAFEQSGVFAQSEMMYKDVLNQLYSIKGTQVGKERNIFEKLPSEDQLNLRLAAVEMQSNKFGTSYDYLKNIKSPEKLSDVDQIERVQMAATLLDKRGETDSAIRYLTELLKVWSGIPELVADPYLHLAQLEIKKDKTADAMESLRKIDVLMEDSKKVNPQTHAKSLELLADLQLKKGQQDEAIKTYEKMLNLYEKQKPMASFRYKVGDLYFKSGEIQKAAQTWNDLKNEKSSFWYKMAQEHLKGSDWNNEYQKYIKRIPAMSSDAKSAPVERK